MGGGRCGHMYKFTYIFIFLSLHYLFVLFLTSLFCGVLHNVATANAFTLSCIKKTKKIITFALLKKFLRSLKTTLKTFHTFLNIFSSENNKLISDEYCPKCVCCRSYSND